MCRTLGICPGCMSGDLKSPRRKMRRPVDFNRCRRDRRTRRSPAPARCRPTNSSRGSTDSPASARPGVAARRDRPATGCRPAQAGRTGRSSLCSTRVRRRPRPETSRRIARDRPGKHFPARADPGKLRDLVSGPDAFLAWGDRASLETHKGPVAGALITLMSLTRPHLRRVLLCRMLIAFAVWRKLVRARRESTTNEPLPPACANASRQAGASCPRPSSPS